MKTTATMFIGGAVSIVLFKLLVAVVMPMVMSLIGIMLMMAKFALIAGVIYFIYSMLFKKKKEEEAEAEA